MSKIISLVGAFIDQSPYNRGEIAKRFEVSRNTVSNWCMGHTYPSIPQLIKLGELLEVHYGDFYIVKKDNQKNE